MGHSSGLLEKLKCMTVFVFKNTIIQCYLLVPDSVPWRGVVIIAEDDLSQGPSLLSGRTRVSPRDAALFCI